MTSRSSVIRVSLIAEAQRFKQGIDDAEGSSAKFTASLKTLGTAAVAALAVKAAGAVKDFAADSIRAFSELEQASGAAESVFGASTEKIDRWAESAARSIGLSEAQAKQSATVLGAFLQNYGYSVDEAAEKSIELTNKGADLAAMFGGTVPDAVGAISAALRGEFNPIERYGVSMRVATIEAHALEMGLAATKGELDQNAKMTATLDLLTQQTAKAHGQFARELDTVAGKDAVFNAELENSKALLGESLAPAKNLFTGMATWGVRSLTDLFGALNRGTGAWDDATYAAHLFNTALREGKAPADAFGEALHEITREGDGFWGNFLQAAFALNTGVEDIDAGVQSLVQSLYDQAGGLEAARDALYQLHAQGDLTIEQYRDYAALLEDVDRKEQILTQTHNDAEHARWRVAEATEELNAETQTAAERLNEMAEAARNNHTAIDGLTEKTKALTEAEDDYNEAVRKFGPDSEEAIAAAMGLSQARADAEAEWAEFFTTFPGGFREAFQHLVDSGVAPDTARAMVAQWQGQFDKMPLHVRLAVPTWTFDSNPSGQVKPKRDGQVFLAQGGVTTGPTPATVGEAGAEAVLPLESSQGIAAIAAAFTKALSWMGGMGAGGSTIQITVNALDPQAAARAVVEALQAYERQYGAVPVNVRS